MWGPQLSALPVGWRGIAPDLRGFGASEGPAEDVTTMDAFADDLAGLLDHLSIERAVVCGLSMGGYIALAMWRRHRDRVRALILSDTRAGADSGEAADARRRLAERVLSEGPDVVADGMLPRLLSPTTSRRDAGTVQLVRAMMLETRPVTMARALLGMAERPDSEEMLASIDVRTLVIVGDEDAITSRGQADLLARGIRPATLEVIDGAGHLPNLEQPAEFNRAMAGFLAGLPAEAGVNG
jgi:pimeloyl-ACP methyl ester carboxylesterase